VNAPWTIAEMSLEQAKAAYRSYRARRNPSTADLRREADLARHIERLEAEQQKRSWRGTSNGSKPLAIAGPIAQMRAEIAARKGAHA